jgi:hypothetical protein
MSSQSSTRRDELSRRLSDETPELSPLGTAASKLANSERRESLSPNPPILPREAHHIDGINRAYLREVNQLMGDIRNARTQLQEQMEFERRKLTVLERTSPPPQVSDEPRQNAGRRGLYDGSLEADGRSLRPNHHNSFGNVCPSKETAAAKSRGAARCAPAGGRVFNQFTLSAGARRDAAPAFVVDPRLDAAAARADRPFSDISLSLENRWNYGFLLFAHAT